MPRQTKNATATRAGRAPVGRPPVISLAEILDAATAIAEDVGIDNLTMGLVADRLGVSAAALYHYVPHKQALVNLVLDAAFAQVQAPPLDAGPWDVRLRMFERTVRTELRRLKWGTPQIILNDDPPESLRRLFAIGVDILTEAGADEREVLLAYTTVYAFMVGQVWFDSATSDPEHEPQILLAAAHAALDGDQIFEFGIEVVIAGLKVQLAQKAKLRPKRRLLR